MPELQVRGGQPLDPEATLRKHATGEMRVLSKKGDVRVTWNARDTDEVEAARKQFNDLRGKRFLAFAVEGDGGKGEQIDEFDPNAQKIIMAPPMAGGQQTTADLSDVQRRASTRRLQWAREQARIQSAQQQAAYEDILLYMLLCESMGPDYMMLSATYGGLNFVPVIEVPVGFDPDRVEDQDGDGDDNGDSDGDADGDGDADDAPNDPPEPASDPAPPDPGPDPVASTDTGSYDSGSSGYDSGGGGGFDSGGGGGGGD